jgi:predicted transcriptional regulator
MNRMAPTVDNDVILTLLRKHEYTPVELLAKLEKEQSLPDSAVKETLSRLLWMGILSLSSEHTLKINEPAPADQPGSQAEPR